jgi:hypothetical protein
MPQVINRVIHQRMRPEFKPGAWEPYVKVYAWAAAGHVGCCRTRDTHTHGPALCGLA